MNLKIISLCANVGLHSRQQKHKYLQKFVYTSFVLKIGAIKQKPKSSFEHDMTVKSTKWILRHNSNL